MHSFISAAAQSYSDLKISMSDLTTFLFDGQSNRKWWTGGRLTTHPNNTSRIEPLCHPWSHVDFTNASELRLALLQEPLTAARTEGVFEKYRLNADLLELADLADLEGVYNLFTLDLFNLKETT